MRGTLGVPARSALGAAGGVAAGAAAGGVAGAADAWAVAARGGWGRCRFAGAHPLDDREHVVAGDPAALASPDDLRSGQLVFAEQAADRGTHASVGIARGGRRGGGRRGGGCGRGRGAFRTFRLARRRRIGSRSVRPVGAGFGGRSRCRGLFGRGGFLLRRRGLSRCAAGLLLGLDHGDLGVVRDGGAFLGEDLLEHARERRRHLGVDLVGDDLEERLVLRDRIARLLQPLADRPLGHALAELGHRHLGHVCSSFEGRRPAGASAGIASRLASSVADPAHPGRAHSPAGRLLVPCSRLRTTCVIRAAIPDSGVRYAPGAC